MSLLPGTIVSKSTTTFTAVRDNSIATWTGLLVTLVAVCGATGARSQLVMTVSTDGNSASYTTNPAVDFATAGTYQGQVVTTLVNGSQAIRSAPFTFTVLPAL